MKHEAEVRILRAIAAPFTHHSHFLGGAISWCVHRNRDMFHGIEPLTRLPFFGEMCSRVKACMFVGCSEDVVPCLPPFRRRATWVHRFVLQPLSVRRSKVSVGVLHGDEGSDVLAVQARERSNSSTIRTDIFDLCGMFPSCSCLGRSQLPCTVGRRTLVHCLAGKSCGKTVQQQNNNEGFVMPFGCVGLRTSFYGTVGATSGSSDGHEGTFAVMTEQKAWPLPLV